jgi:hypothetical protein
LVFSSKIVTILLESGYFRLVLLRKERKRTKCKEGKPKGNTRKPRTYAQSLIGRGVLLLVVELSFSEKLFQFSGAASIVFHLLALFVLIRHCRKRRRRRKRNEMFEIGQTESRKNIKIAIDNEYRDRRNSNELGCEPPGYRNRERSTYKESIVLL